MNTKTIIKTISALVLMYLVANLALMFLNHILEKENENRCINSNYTADYCDGGNYAN